jgi:hypothetical protein
MLHTCAARFNVNENLEKILGTKQGLTLWCKAEYCTTLRAAEPSAQVGGANRSSGEAGEQTYRSRSASPGSQMATEHQLNWPPQRRHGRDGRPGLPGASSSVAIAKQVGRQQRTRTGQNATILNGRGIFVASSGCLRDASRAVRIGNSAAGSHHRRSQGTGLPTATMHYKNVPAVDFESSRTPMDSPREHSFPSNG